MSLCDSLRLAIAGILLLGEAAVAVSAMHPHVDRAYRAFFIDHTADTWPPCHPEPGAIPVEGAIAPQQLSPDAACALLRRGWSKPEAWGVWNLGHVSRLEVPYTSRAHTLALTVAGHVRPGRTQALTVLVDGRKAGRFLLSGSPNTISMPLPPTNQPRVATVELRIADPFSPIDQGDSSDARPLGVGLVRLDRIEVQHGCASVHACDTGSCARQPPGD